MYSVMKLKFMSHCGRVRISSSVLAPDAPRAILLIVHGIGGSFSKYDELSRTLCGDGFVVCGADLFGHGESVSDEMPPGSFGGWWNAAADVHTLAQFVRRKYPGLPFFLFGHSMGSFLCRTYLSIYHEPIAGCILCGTGQKPHSLYMLGRALTDAGSAVSGRDARSGALYRISSRSYCRRIYDAVWGTEWITRDSALLASGKIKAAPPSAGLLQDMLKGLEYNSRPASTARIDKNIPFFLISGTEDPIGDYGKGVIAASQSLVKAGIDDVKVKFYPGARHELINETNRAEVIGDIRGWLLDRLKK